jgi:hypothetical protein
MTLVLRNCDYEADGLKFSDPMPNKHNGQTIYINYQHQERTLKQTLIQSPWMTNPFGLNKSPEQPGEEPKYYVELSFGNAPSAYVESFHEKMRATDAVIRNTAAKRSVEWLGRSADEVDEEFMDEFHKPIVRAYKNKEKVATGEYPDTMRFKVPHYINTNEESGDETVSFGGLEVYNARMERIPISNIDELRTALGKGNRVRVIAHPSSVWKSGNEFGVSWRLLRLQIINQESGGLGEDCAFDQSDEINGANNSDEDEEY